MARRKKLNEEQPYDSNNSPENEDDTFGLPEVEYEPLNREEQQTEAPVEEPVASTPPPSAYESTQTYRDMERDHNTYDDSNNEYNEEESGSAWPKILGILAILLLTGAAIWYFGFYNPRMAEKERLRKEQLAREQAEKDEADRRAQLEREAEQRRADSLANLQPKAGEILTLTGRTGRYYVVIASSVDGDLVMDYAKKLAPKGVSPRIIPPHGKVKFYRLAIEEGDTFESTQSKADALKSEYSEGAWVVKY